MLEAIIYKW